MDALTEKPGSRNLLDHFSTVTDPRALQHRLWRQHREECTALDSYLVDMETDLMRTERPYPGQLWKHDSLRVIVVAVSPNTVTYEDLSGRAGVTRDSLSNFLAGFTRLKSPAR